MNIEALAALKVPELKAMCKDLGLKVSGKKDELIERICAYRAAEHAAGGAGKGQVTPVDMAEESPGEANSEEESEEVWHWGTGDAGSDVWGEAQEDRGGAGLEGGFVPIIKFLSTRGNAKSRWRGRLSEALREGQSHDGGLLVPTALPDLRAVLPTWAELSFPEMAVELAEMWMGKEVDRELLESVFRDEAFEGFADRREPLPVRKVMVRGLGDMDLGFGVRG